MGRTTGLVAAAIGLLTATLGLTSSPVAAPRACRAIGACGSSASENNASGGDNNRVRFVNRLGQTASVRN